MKKVAREAKAEQSTRAAQAIVKAEAHARRKKTERLRKLRKQMDASEVPEDTEAGGEGLK
jgi:hypothetical protein